MFDNGIFFGERPHILAIDFDDTVVENAFPEIGKLRKNAREIINKFFEEGFYIIFWTCRSGSELGVMRDFLIDVGINFHKINENASYEILGFQPSPKIYYDTSIDDKNLDCPLDWDVIYDRVHERVNSQKEVFNEVVEK